MHLLSLSLSRAQCHGLWDEDDPKASHKDECLHRDDSLDEGKMAVAIPPEEEKKSSPAYSLNSVNLGMSVDSSQVHVQILYPEHRPHLQRRALADLTCPAAHLCAPNTVRNHNANIPDLKFTCIETHALVLLALLSS